MPGPHAPESSRPPVRPENAGFSGVSSGTPETGLGVSHKKTTEKGKTSKKKVNKKNVAGFYYHAAEYHRKIQKERGFLGKIVGGLVEPFSLHVRALRLRMAAKRSGGEDSSVLNTTFIEKALDGLGGSLGGRDSEIRKHFRAKSQAHGVILEAARKGLSEEDVTSLQTILGSLLERNGDITDEQRSQYASLVGEKNMDSVYSLASIIKNNREAFQTPDEMKRSVSDEIIDGGLTPDQQILAKRIARAARRNTVWTALNYAKVPVLIFLSVTPASPLLFLGIGGAFSFAARYSRLAKEGQVHDISKSRGIDTSQHYGLLSRIFSVDWDSDPQHRGFQLVRAAGLGALTGIALKAIGPDILHSFQHPESIGSGLTVAHEHPGDVLETFKDRITGQHPDFSGSRGGDPTDIYHHATAHGSTEGLQKPDNAPPAHTGSAGAMVKGELPQPPSTETVNYSDYLSHHSVHDVASMHDPNAPLGDKGPATWAYGEHDQAIYDTNGHVTGLEIDKYGNADSANVLYVNANGNNVILQLQDGKISLSPDGKNTIMELVDKKFVNGQWETVKPFWQQTDSATVCKELGITQPGLENWVEHGNPAGVSTDWDFVNGQTVVAYNFSLAHYDLAANGHTANIDILATAQGHGHIAQGLTFDENVPGVGPKVEEATEVFHNSHLAGIDKWEDSNVLGNNPITDWITDAQLYGADTASLLWDTHPGAAVAAAATVISAGFLLGRHHDKVPPNRINKLAGVATIVGGFLAPEIGIPLLAGWGAGRLTNRTKKTTKKEGPKETAPGTTAAGAGETPNSGPTIPSGQASQTPVGGANEEVQSAAPNGEEAQGPAPAPRNTGGIVAPSQQGIPTPEKLPATGGEAQSSGIQYAPPAPPPAEEAVPAQQAGLQPNPETVPDVAAVGIPALAGVAQVLRDRANNGNLDLSKTEGQAEAARQMATGLPEGNITDLTSFENAQEAMRMLSPQQDDPALARAIQRAAFIENKKKEGVDQNTLIKETLPNMKQQVDDGLTPEDAALQEGMALYQALKTNEKERDKDTMDSILGFLQDEYGDKKIGKAVDGLETLWKNGTLPTTAATAGSEADAGGNASGQAGEQAQISAEQEPVEVHVPEEALERFGQAVEAVRAQQGVDPNNVDDVAEALVKQLSSDGTLLENESAARALVNKWNDKDQEYQLPDDELIKKIQQYADVQTEAMQAKGEGA